MIAPISHYCEKHLRNHDEDRGDDRIQYFCPDCEDGKPAYEARCAECFAAIASKQGRYYILGVVLCVKCGDRKIPDNSSLHAY